MSNIKIDIKKHSFTEMLEELKKDNSLAFFKDNKLFFFIKDELNCTSIDIRKDLGIPNCDNANKVIVDISALSSFYYKTDIYISQFISYLCLNEIRDNIINKKTVNYIYGNNIWSIKLNTEDSDIILSNTNQNICIEDYYKLFSIDFLKGLIDQRGTWVSVNNF